MEKFKFANSQNGSYINNVNDRVLSKSIGWAQAGVLYRNRLVLYSQYRPADLTRLLFKIFLVLNFEEFGQIRVWSKNWRIFFIFYFSETKVKGNPERRESVRKMFKNTNNYFFNTTFDSCQKWFSEVSTGGVLEILPIVPEVWKKI